MRLFNLLLIGMLTASLSADAQTKAASADEILQPVYAKATKENKNVLVIFHASWCGWCRKMDSSLHDKVVQPLIDKHYEIAHLVVYESPNKKELENPGALELLTKHGGDDKGLPYWFVLDKNGNKLADSQYKPGENTGCPASEEEVAHFINVLKKTSSLKEEKLKLIEKRFRKNEQ